MNFRTEKGRDYKYTKTISCRGVMIHTIVFDGKEVGEINSMHDISVIDKIIDNYLNKNQDNK